MTILAATILNGPYKGWPLGVSEAIAHGRISPKDAKKALIADCVRRKAEIDQEISAYEILPDEIIL